MNITQLRPASEFAQQYGVKSLVYGPPGVGKTPIANSAPRPVLCVTEPGMLSMRNSNIPAWPAFTPRAIDEFFDWLFGSNEPAQFDTIVIDSVSQMCETILTEELGKNRDGRKAYGELSRRIMKHMNGLYYFPRKHTYLICKQSNENGRVRPFFPGQDLNVKIPHLYDEILHCAIANIPNVGTNKAFRTRDELDVMARDRSGRLDQFEQCNLAALFAKAMS